ncbi:MAG: restriction endonuclease subunit S [Tidjanibacter sp.]|nr:restriction endonuclease subunit S [Tidjanibacter sp.]
MTKPCAMRLNNWVMSASSVKWVQLGEYIEPCDERNSEGKYTLDDVRGISIQKKLIFTKADMQGVSLTPYKLLKPREFSYVTVTSRNGGKISLAINDTENTYIVSSSYENFRCKDVSKLLPEYLFLLLSRSEFDRYSRFNSWGSARETFDWSEFCRTEIPLPSIEVQQELVDTYNGLKALAEQNEALIEPLSKACEAFIVDCKTKYPEVELGEYIDIYKEKNSDCKIELEQGINIDKQFITPQRSNSDLSSRIIVRKGQFAYCTQLNNENVAIAYREGEDCVVSPVYNAFEIKPSKSEELLPKYLFLWVKRREFGRYVYWKSVGSAYEFLQEENLCEYKIPIPPIEVQRSIVKVYTCLEESKKIASEAREKLKTLCPALVQRAANS